MDFLLLLIILSGILHIIGLIIENPSLKMVFKPLTTLLIIFFAFSRGDAVSAYKTLLLAGLVFALIGDIFLMLPREQFVAGLVSFLIAHLFFILAFTGNHGFYWNWIYLAPIFVYFTLLINILIKHTGKMTLPVIVYSVVIMIFVWQAAGRYATLPNSFTVFALYGAILFVLSDSLLAYDKFVKPMKWAHSVVMILYWTALYFLALSV